MRSLIEVTPELTETTTQLRRIADALETILWLQFNYRMTPTPSMATDDTEVGYSSDQETFKQELLDVAAHRNPLRPIEGDEEDDGLKR